MKKYIQILFALVILASLSACVNTARVGQSNTGYHPSGGASAGQVYAPAVAAPTNGDVSIFGNQPQEPTAEAVANPTTWGEVNGNVSGWNELRPSTRSRVQNIPAGTPIFVDRTNGWAWKQACHNRVRPYVAPVAPVVEQPQQEVASDRQTNQSVVQQSQSWQFSLNIPISINGQPLGGGYGGGYCPPQQQYRQQQRPQCVRVPIRDRCGRIIGWRMVPAGRGY